MEYSPTLAVIGGSGLYQMSGLTKIQEHDLETPFGKPSAPLITGYLEGELVAFLARHGLGHHLSPSEVNYRANIFALKMLGVERVLSISACGSLREDFAPGDVVIPDQIFDFTRDRKRTFFEDHCVAHISVADPFCPQLSALAAQAVASTGINLHIGGSLITIEGPRFSTKAESQTFRAWGMSVIGMTASPEVFLAREAEMCYCTMAHVTDYDVWHVSEEPVTVEIVIEILLKNTAHAQNAVHALTKDLPKGRDCTCGQALASALITDPKAISPETHQRLGLLINKYMKAE